SKSASRDGVRIATIRTSSLALSFCASSLPAEVLASFKVPQPAATVVGGGAALLRHGRGAGAMLACCLIHSHGGTCGATLRRHGRGGQGAVGRGEGGEGRAQWGGGKVGRGGRSGEGGRWGGEGAVGRGKVGRGGRSGEGGRWGGEGAVGRGKVGRGGRSGEGRAQWGGGKVGRAQWGGQGAVGREEGGEGRAQWGGGKVGRGGRSGEGGRWGGEGAVGREEGGVRRAQWGGGKVGRGGRSGEGGRWGGEGAVGREEGGVRRAQWGGRKVGWGGRSGEGGRWGGEGAVGRREVGRGGRSGEGGRWGGEGAVGRGQGGEGAVGRGKVGRAQWGGGRWGGRSGEGGLSRRCPPPRRASRHLCCPREMQEVRPHLSVTFSPSCPPHPLFPPLSCPLSPACLPLSIHPTGHPSAPLSPHCPTPSAARQSGSSMHKGDSSKQKVQCAMAFVQAGLTPPVDLQARLRVEEQGGERGGSEEGEEGGANRESVGEEESREEESREEGEDGGEEGEKEEEQQGGEVGDMRMVESWELLGELNFLYGAGSDSSLPGVAGGQGIEVTPIFFSLQARQLTVKVLYSSLVPPACYCPCAPTTPSLNTLRSSHRPSLLFNLLSLTPILPRTSSIVPHSPGFLTQPPSLIRTLPHSSVLSLTHPSLTPILTLQADEAVEAARETV
ncbi:unnamed protein product, partial [Closterium sp. Naga37s-1]